MDGSPQRQGSAKGMQHSQSDSRLEHFPRLGQHLHVHLHHHIHVHGFPSPDLTASLEHYPDFERFPDVVSPTCAGKYANKKKGVIGGSRMGSPQSRQRQRGLLGSASSSGPRPHKMGQKNRLAAKGEGECAPNRTQWGLPLEGEDRASLQDGEPLAAAATAMSSVFSKKSIGLLDIGKKMTVAARLSQHGKHARRSLLEGDGFLGAKGKAEATAIFTRLTGESHEMIADPEKLGKAFELGGHPYSVRIDWLMRTIEEEMDERHVIDLEDFVILWDSHAKQIRDLQLDLFNQAVAEEGREMTDRRVSEASLSSILQRCGIVPMPGAIAEAISEFAPAGSRDVDFDIFLRIHDLLYSRAGLTGREHTHLLGCFRLHDLDGSDNISTWTLRHMLQWHELLVGPIMGLVPNSVIDALVAEVVDQIGKCRMSLEMEAWKLAMQAESASDRRASLCDIGVNSKAFLLVSRMLHECIATAVQEVMRRVALDPAIDITFDELLLLFDEVGSVSSSLPQVLRECMEQTNLQDRTTFSFGDVYTLLLAFVSVNGFTHGETQECANIFDTFGNRIPDIQHGGRRGTLKKAEMCRGLRWLGYCPSEYRTYDFFETYDVEPTDDMDVKQFIKLVADYRFLSIGKARHDFRTLSNNTCRWHSIPTSAVASLFGVVGHAQLSSKMLQTIFQRVALSDGQIDWRAFVIIEDVYRKILRPQLERNIGFSDEAKDEHWALYEKELLLGNDYLLFKGLGKIVSKLFPALSLEEVRVLVLETDQNGDGRVGFKEYLWIMRRLQERQERRTVEIARNVARKELGYSKDEVRQLRELFSLTDKDMSGSVDFKELQAIFKNLVPMCAEAACELSGFMEQVKKNADGELDFWEFLRVMRTVQDKNWRNINGVSSSTSAR